MRRGEMSLTRSLAGYILRPMKGTPQQMPRLTALAVCAAVFAACTTQPEAPSTGVPSRTPVVEASTPPRPLTRPSPPPPPPEPEPEPEPTQESETGEFVVTTEIYEKTFDELAGMIRDWNAIIARKDYAAWHENLSEDYITTRSADSYLSMVSRMQKLRNQNTVLRTLEDFFVHVVVPSRVDAELDNIVFVNENKVKAYAVIDGESAVLFYVVKEDGRWKIGTSEE